MVAKDTRYGGFENIDQPSSTVERANAALTSQSALNDSIARMRIDDIFQTQGVQKMQLYRNQVSLGSVPMLDFREKAYAFQIVGQVGDPMTREHLQQQLDGGWAYPVRTYKVTASGKKITHGYLDEHRKYNGLNYTPAQIARMSPEARARLFNDYTRTEE